MFYFQNNLIVNLPPLLNNYIINIKPIRIMSFIKKFRKIIIPRLLLGMFLGAISGFAYYYFIGCNSGSCAITSSPINSTLYGLLSGGVLFFKIREESEEQQII